MSFTIADFPTPGLPVIIVSGKSFMLLTASSFMCALSTWRSEEHTSELQSQSNLVCRLLLEKKKHDQFRKLLCALIIERDAAAMRGDLACQSRGCRARGGKFNLDLVGGGGDGRARGFPGRHF